MIHLDTSFLIPAFVRGSKADRTLRGWIDRDRPLGISAVAWTEFLCGPVEADVISLVSRLVGEPVAFGSAEAALASHLFNETGRRRGSLADCMIAATAIQAGASLATGNPRDFNRLVRAGLEVLGT